jgi:hypothetical protein
VFTSIPLYPLDDSSQSLNSCDAQKYLQTLSNTPVLQYHTWFKTIEQDDFEEPLNTYPQKTDSFLYKEQIALGGAKH